MVEMLLFLERKNRWNAIKKGDLPEVWVTPLIRISLQAA
jgi:hypothetical protein